MKTLIALALLAASPALAETRACLDRVVGQTPDEVRIEIDLPEINVTIPRDQPGARFYLKRIREGAQPSAFSCSVSIGKMAPQPLTVKRAASAKLKSTIGRWNESGQYANGWFSMALPQDKAGLWVSCGQAYKPNETTYQDFLDSGLRVKFTDAKGKPVNLVDCTQPLEVMRAQKRSDVDREAVAERSHVDHREPEKSEHQAVSPSSPRAL
jgi:hypothetical protein